MDKPEHIHCPTRLLDDLPADHDAFGSHSHQRVAEAIADLIKTEEEGGKAIALIGPWGSGKSTVVKLLKKNLEEESGKKEIKVFVFDAWAHKGDPLRRSFLEELVSFLRKEGWAKPKQWEDELDAIRQRREEITTDTQPILSKTGKILGISLLLFSLGCVLLGSGLGKANAWLLGIGSFLVASPFMIVLISLLIQHFCHRRQNKSENNQNNRKESQNKDLLLVFINKTREIVRTKATRTPDPTSIEFQGLFSKILDDALSKGERCLVITIDNLDRVSKEEARSIWATMRAFFELGAFFKLGNEKHRQWMRRCWLLVPLAPDTPSRLWQEDEKKDLAEEFIDKTFQVKFYVPLPVMSDWKEFFEKQLEEAFPKHFKHHQEDLYAVYRVFDSKRACGHRPPTPREIKLFINQLGAYHRIWQDEIPLPVQALYVLDVSKRIDTEGAEQVLLNKKELIKDVEGVESISRESRLQEYLAALHFNVEPEKAVQVLIGDEVKRALLSGQSGQLKKLQEQVEEAAFRTVMYNIITGEWHEWAKNEPPALAKAALALQELEQDESYEWKLIWRHIIQGTREAQWTNLDKDLGKGIAAVLRRAKDKEVAKDVLAHIMEPELPRESEAQRSVDVARNWAQGVMEVLYEIYQSGYQDILSKFKVPGGAEFYVEVMHSLAENENKETSSVVEYFVPKADPNAVVQHLAALCQNGNFVDSHADVVHLMLKVNAEWDWAPLIQQIRQRLQTPNITLQLPELKGYLKALLVLDKEEIPQANATLQRLSQQGHLLHWLNYAHTRSDQETVGLCLLPIIEHLPSGSASSLPGRAQDGQQLYQRFLNAPPEDIAESLFAFALKFRKGDVFLQKVEGEQSIKHLVAKVLQKVIEQERTPEFVSCSAIIDHYRILHDMLQSNLLSEDEFRSLITQLVERAGLIRELMEKGFSEDLADLYLRALEYSSGRLELEEFIEYLTENLRNVPKETWVRELTNEGQLVALIVSLVEKGTTIGLSNNFHDALFEHAKQVFEKRTFPSRFAGRWDKVFAALADAHRWTFLRNLRDELINQHDKDGTYVLKLYGNLLLSMPEVLEEEADRAVRLWFTKMLERRNPEELAWVERFLGETEIYQKCTDSTQEFFCGAIQHAWEGEEDEQVKKRLEAIAGAIGLELISPRNPELSESHGEESSDAE